MLENGLGNTSTDLAISSPTYHVVRFTSIKNVCNKFKKKLHREAKIIKLSLPKNLTKYIYSNYSVIFKSYTLGREQDLDLNTIVVVVGLHM